MACSISIIIPVFRETRALAPMLRHLRADADTLGIERIVVDGDPSGSTIRTIEDPGVQKRTAPRGRGAQLNAGAEQATGEVLLFLHADTRLPAGGLKRIGREMADDHIVGGGFQLGIASDKPVFRVIERAVSLRTRLTRIPYGDQAIFMRRFFFEAIGGFSPLPIMEDVDLMRRVKKTGARIRILPLRAMTSPRRWEKEGTLYCTLRNWTLISLYLLGVSAEKLSRYYRS